MTPITKNIITKPDSKGNSGNTETDQSYNTVNDEGSLNKIEELNIDKLKRKRALNKNKKFPE